MYRVGVGEDVVRRLPVGVLIGIAEARHPKRRRVSERAPKVHGGSIEVDTQPGEFTEFRIVLPRAGASLIKSGERA